MCTVPATYPIGDPSRDAYHRRTKGFVILDAGARSIIRFPAAATPYRLVKNSWSRAPDHWRIVRHAYAFFAALVGGLERHQLPN